MRHITACYQLNANQKYYPIMKLLIKNVSKYAIQKLFNILSRNIMYVDKKYYKTYYWQELENVSAREMKCTQKEFQIFHQQVSSILAKRYTKYAMKRVIKVVIEIIVN